MVLLSLFRFKSQFKPCFGLGDWGLANESLSLIRCFFTFTSFSLSCPPLQPSDSNKERKCRVITAAITVSKLIVGQVMTVIVNHSHTSVTECTCVLVCNFILQIFLVNVGITNST